MKIIVLRKNLKDGLGIISGVRGININLPILKNILIETEENKIKISVTNLELAIINYVSGKIIEKGAIVIPSDIFFNIINSIQEERITLEVKNKNLIIQTDNYQAKIQGIEKEEFPIIPRITNNKFHLEISKSLINKSLVSVINSVQSSEIRPELNGVLLDYHINLLKLVATDSFRLSEKNINNSDFNSDINNKFRIIIPSRTIQEVIKSFTDNEEKVNIFFDSNQVLFKDEKTEIISRLINGEFPDYLSIIPQSIETEVILNKERFINALKLTSAFASRMNEVKILVKENAKNVEVYSSNQGLGENRYLIPAKIKGQALETAFNWRFLLDGVKHLESENVFLGLNNNNKPALLKSPEDNSLLCVIMPIRV